MKKLSLGIVFSIFCLVLYPCLLFAEEPLDSPVQEVQSEVQKVADAPTVLSDQTDNEQISTVETEKGDESLEDSGEVSEEPAEYAESNINHGAISDPLEPVNRAFFVFNDKLYFWFLKPVSKGYIAITPEQVRVGVRNFFSNLGFPIRFINCLLQAKLSGAGYEFERFFINSTLGLAGFFDMADREFGVKAFDEDFGQTLAFYGVGQGFYINWPFLGPSSGLDSVGLAGDLLLDPAFYFLDLKSGIAEKSFKTFNSSSFSLEDYEALKDSALDPYVAFRDAYIQYRQVKIKK